MKKESLQIMTVKTLLAVVIFAGVGTIILGGGYIVGEYGKNKAENKIIKPVDQKTYYQELAESCEKFKKSKLITDYDCCLQIVEIMQKGNFKLAVEGICPDGFQINSLWCGGAYNWCEPVEEIACNQNTASDFLGDKKGSDPCDRSCEFDSDCKFECGCECISKDEKCEYTGIECEMPNPNYGCQCVNRSCEYNYIDTDAGTADWQTYRNEEFGFEVKYPENDSFSKYKIKQIGNTFYIAFSDYKDIKDGQFVTIFTKDSEDSLKQAIEKKFLKNFSQKDCFVNEKNINYLFNYSKNYIVLSAIDYPDREKHPFENKNNCPYAISNGKSYFLMDINYPDKFAFFSIGQYSIPAALEGVEIFWQDTFKFIEN